VIAGGLFPWSLLLPAASLSRDRAAEPAIWAAVVIVFFSLGQAKLATYVLPAFPALALWIACGLTTLTSLEGERRARATRLLSAAVVVWAVLLTLLPLGLLVFVRSRYPELTSVVAWSVPLPLLAWLGARRIRGEALRPRAVCAVFAAVNVALLVVFYARATPFVSLVASDAAIASAAHRLAPGATILGFKIQPASLSYYAAGGAVRRARDTDEIRAAASRGPLLIVTRRRHERALRDAGIPLYVWLDTRRHLLYATVPVS
jgi:4-amino-4-deoxy-L-arabinose transferase-like glycosyltransferase